MIAMLLITGIMNKMDMIHGWWLFLLILGWICTTIKIFCDND